MVVVRRPSLSLVISSIDFFADATAAIPVHSLKCSGFFPLFRKRLTTTFSAAASAASAGIVFGLRDSYSAFKFLPNSVAAVWSNENFKTAPKHLCAALPLVRSMNYDAETAPTDDETTPLNNLPFLGRQLRHDARA